MKTSITSSARPAWILLISSLPTKRATERVHIWRNLKRYGALSLKSGGHLLPNSPVNVEHFQWLAVAIRKFKGNASVIQVHSLDDLPDKQLRHLFVEARTQDYQVLMSELKKVLCTSELRSSALGRLRRRFQEITAIDFFNSPLRNRTRSRSDKEGISRSTMDHKTSSRD